MSSEPCGVCGGDGRIANSFSGSTAQCPGCRGTGRRSEGVTFRDVTKTKPSHFRQPNKAAEVKKQQEPTSFEGIQLANEVRDSATLSANTKAKLKQEIIEHETTHGKCTQTFLKKVRKQLRAP